MRNDDGKTKRNTRLRQEYHPHLLARCTLVRGRESGACARIDGRASLPGSAGPRKSRVARTVSSLQFRSDIRATSDLRADRTSADSRPRSFPYREARPRVETGVATRRRHACRHDGKKGCVLLSRHVRFSSGLTPVSLMSILDVLASKIKLQGN